MASVLKNSLWADLVNLLEILGVCSLLATIAVFMVRYAKGKTKIVCHPLISLFFGFSISLVLWPWLSQFFETFIADEFLAQCVAMVVSLFIGGFTATALTRAKKPLMGIFAGISFAMVIIGTWFIGEQPEFGYQFFVSVAITLSLCFFSAGAGVLTAIKSKNHFLRKQEISGTQNISGNTTNVDEGYLVCDKCHEYYKLQPGESPDDFLGECECGGKLQYYDKILF